MQSLRDVAVGVFTKVDAVGLEEAAGQITPIARVRYVQLEPGVARVQGAILQLSNLAVARLGADRNKIVRAETSPGRIALFVPTRGLARLGTTTLLPENAVLVSRPAELVAFTDRQFLPVCVSAALFRCHEVAADLRADLRIPQADVSVLRISQAFAFTLDQLAQSLFEVAAMPSSLCGVADSAAVLEESVLQSCVALINGDHTAIRPRECAAARRRAVLRAREFIDAHLDQPLSLARICRASYASARALEYGFREMFSVSPMTYARCARLSRVRRELYLAERQPKAVTRLAMKWGFLHLGQFSRNYRILFGESPSVTLARGERTCANLIAAMSMPN